ncbi:hypothetical protein [Yinghuangia sp. YIM S10712]|uniref:hypothetical protein n=1 Tax=Yinghuangia sp. YIM S10712 TaxID=3436930 RepID=UPI003F538EF4
MTQRQTARLAQAIQGAPRWLAKAADDPAEYRTLWLAEPAAPQLLATGRTFDAVVVTDELGVRTLEAYHRIAAPALPAVIDHRSRKVAFLIASCGREFFASTVAALHGEVSYRYLSLGDYLLVPGPLAEVGAPHQWLCPPRPGPDLSAGAVVMLAGNLVASARRAAKTATEIQGVVDCDR